MMQIGRLQRMVSALHSTAVRLHAFTNRSIISTYLVNPSRHGRLDRSRENIQQTTVVWSAKVADLFVDYVRPQDNGYRTGARWVEFVDAKGSGVRFAQSEPIAFQALEYGWEELYFSRHLNGERRRRAPLVPEDATLLNIDVRQTGLGGESCGPQPLEQYRFNPHEKVEWTLCIERIGV